MVTLPIVRRAGKRSGSLTDKKAKTVRIPYRTNTIISQNNCIPNDLFMDFMHSKMALKIFKTSLFDVFGGLWNLEKFHKFSQKFSPTNLIFSAFPERKRQ